MLLGEITIAPRFCGPPNSGNGGYTTGILGQRVSGAAAVTLRLPPPLGRPLRLERQGERIKLLDGMQCVAEAEPAELGLRLPEAPSWEEACAAAARYPGFHEHAFPTCFVCGPQRMEGDGLRIFCGPWRDGMVAGTWVPDASLGGPDGRVLPEFLWSAADCPGACAVLGRTDSDAPVAPPRDPIVLGRLTARIERELRVGERCTVIGWFLAAEGRKYEVGAAVFNARKEPVISGRGLWIRLRKESES